MRQGGPLRDVNHLIRHLPYFVAAAEEEHFHRAAQRLSISQPALSRRIRELEDELGLQLFERSTHGAQLTEAGRLLLEDAKRILLEFGHATERARQAGRGSAGRLRIGYSEVALQHGGVQRSFQAFRAQFPGVQLELAPASSALQLARVLARELDAGFVFELEEPHPELGRLRLAAYPPVLVLPHGHRLAAQRRVGLRDLADEAFVWFTRTQSPRLYDGIMAACVAGGLRPRIVLEVTNTETAISSVAEGAGIAMVFAPIAALRSDVQTRPLADLPLSVNLDLIWRRESRSPPLSRYRDLVESQLTAEAGRAA